MNERRSRRRAGIRWIGQRSPPRRHPAMRFLAQFHNTPIYFLLCAALAAFALGYVVDAAVIVAVVVVNAVLGFIQEGKAEEAPEAIRDMIAAGASVRHTRRKRNRIALSFRDPARQGERYADYGSAELQEGGLRADMP